MVICQRMSNLTHTDPLNMGGLGHLRFEDG